MESIQDFCKKVKVPTPDHIKIKKKYFKVSPAVKQILDKVKLDAQYAGEYLGEDSKEFKPSPNLLEYCIQNGAKSRKVEEKVAYLFTCGRDILNINVGGWVIILDSTGSILGLGKGDGNTVDNYWDVGDFLRREKNRRN